MDLGGTSLVLALFGLGGGDVIIILGAVLILFGTKRVPEFHEGLRRGFWEFRKSSKEVAEELDNAASDAGRSFAGIQGPPAAQAITPENQVAELYRPSVFGERQPPEAEWKAILSVLRYLIETPPARFSLLLLMAATAAALAITAMHPVIATQFKGSTGLILTLDALIGATAAAVILLLVRKLIRK
jgi:sec-independent protein translocase protein TatA